MILAIDEPTFQELQHTWPFPRSVHAALLKRLHDEGAAAVGLDIVFADPSTEAEDAALAQAIAETGPVVLAASTREGEEPGLLAAWQAACASLPSDEHRPRLWIVPRHPQRFDEVATLVREAGLNLSRRSVWSQGMPDAAAQSADVWLGDSMGEMPAYYASAQVALLGGSFQPLGGQNLIEAAACACPIVMGPSTFNFAEAAELSLSAGASFRVQDWASGVAQAVGLVRDPAALAQARASAQAFSQAHRGAAQRMAEAIAATVRGRAQA